MLFIQKSSKLNSFVFQCVTIKVRAEDWYLGDALYAIRSSRGFVQWDMIWDTVREYKTCKHRASKKKISVLTFFVLQKSHC